MAKQTFEKAISRLQQIVEDIGTEDLALEEALKKFEEGMKLSRFCAKTLDDTENKITILLKNHDADPVEKPFFNENVS